MIQQFHFKLINLILISIFLTGCLKSTTNNFNTALYPIKINTKLQIPKVCRSEYDYILPKVAVLDFVNNSTYDKAKVDDKDSSGAIGLGIGITGFVAGAKQNSSRVKRAIDAKLSASITPLIENIVLNTGGAILYTRDKLDKIEDELKLQESGLLDPNSVVKFGKLSGVQYLITGTIDNATALYRGYSKYTNSFENVARNTQNDKLKLATSLLSLGTSFFDGTDIQTNITIKIIDVSSGKIVFTKSLENKIKIANTKSPTYDQIISGLKNSISDIMPELKKDFSKHFKLQSYITQIRKDKDGNTIARIKLGTKHKIEAKDEFSVFSLEENIDPLTNTKSCDKIKLPFVLKATSQISENKTWTKVQNTNTNDIKILQLVQKI